LSPTTARHLPRKMESLTSNLRFEGRIFEAGGHFRQDLRGCRQVPTVDVIKEMTSNAREVYRPGGFHLGHAPRRELGDVTPCVGRTRRLGHESTRLEIVHQTSRSARREIRGAGQIRHSQLTVRGFRKMHDRGVLTRGQAHAPYEVAVEQSRKYFQNSHLGAPQRFLISTEWFGCRHANHFNLLCQAIIVVRASTARKVVANHNLNKYRKVGAQRVN
jgi:hypothetical protein